MAITIMQLLCFSTGMILGLGTMSIYATPVHKETFEKRDITGTSNVYFGEQTGDAKFMASGVLLGLPLGPNQIADHWLSDIKFWNMRSGGSQLPEPSRGWTRGYDEFMGRYNSLKADYEVTRRHGGDFQIMIHDMWGADSWPSVAEVPMPGDNGSYEDFDNFLDTFFNLLIADGITENVWWDLWNEIDNINFHERGLDRWLEYWGHAHHKIVTEFPGGKTIGPSYGHLPEYAGDTQPYFTEWAKFIKTNDSIPDKISLHFLYANGNLNLSIATWTQFFNDAGITEIPQFLVQEYGNIDQQIPSTTAWNFAQLERHNIPGLRANWRGGYELHDYLADLLSKPEHYPNHDPTASDYFPAREYPLYLYYAQMVGYRVRTEMTEDTLGDTFVVVNPDQRRVKILAGCRPVTGTWSITLHQLSELGLPTTGQLPIQTWRFNNAADIYAPATGPDDLSYYTHQYDGDTLFFYIGQEDPNVAYAFEFSY